MIDFLVSLIRKSSEKEKKKSPLFPQADWWHDTNFINEITESRGGFVKYHTRMEEVEESLLKKISFPKGYLFGPIDHVSVQGSEGPVWCLFPSEFGRMPTPIRSDLAVAVFEPIGDSFVMNLVRLNEIKRDEFARYAQSAIFCAPGKILR